MQTTLTISDIAEKLESAGCTVKIWNDKRVYVTKTSCGSTGDYGYCVEGDDARDITKMITKRKGEIFAILNA